MTSLHGRGKMVIINISNRPIKNKHGLFISWDEKSPKLHIYHLSDEDEERLCLTTSIFWKVQTDDSGEITEIKKNKGIESSQYLARWICEDEEVKVWTEPKTYPVIKIIFLLPDLKNPVDGWVYVTKKQYRELGKKQYEGFFQVKESDKPLKIKQVTEDKEEIQEEFRRIAIMPDFHGLGDILMLSSPIRLIKERYKDRREIALILDEEFKPLFKENPYVDEMIKPKDFNGDKFDQVFEVSNRHMLYRRKVRPNVLRSPIDLFCEDVEIKGKKKNLNFYLAEGEILKAKEILSEFTRKKIGIHMEASTPIKRWPYFKTLLELIDKDLDADVFILGKKKEEGVRGISLYGYDLRTTAALLNEMDVFIGIDSLLYHLSSALCVPTIGLFGYTNGRIYSRNYPYTEIIQGKCPHSDSPCCPVIGRTAPS